MSHRQRRISITSIALMLFSAFLVCNSRAQQKPDSTPQTVDWKDLKQTIQAVLDARELKCQEERAWIDIVQTGDVTGDGIPEALVEYCHMGAYTSSVELMRLEHGNPEPARFRDEKRKIVQKEFLRGASVRNGESVALLPKEHAVYAIHWHTDDSGTLETCTVDAYVWAPRSRTFDQNGKLSKEIAQRECVKLRKELECAAHPCSEKKR